jgi:acyl-homoserine lactone acylase PvdQ
VLAVRLTVTSSESARRTAYRLRSGVTVRVAALLAAAVSLTAAAPASAQVPDVPNPIPPGLLPGKQAPEPLPYGANDGGGFRDVLPSGTRGHYSAADLAAFLGAGRNVPHCCDQLGMYGDLVYATPGLQPDQIGRYFKDATFGVREGDVERRYSPRGDVTILRDKGFGVPHVYGETRDGAMFGLGYAGAEDRLFFMDVLRHAGRAELAGFAGGSNAGMDAEQWEVAPYTEQDLQRQADQLDDVLGPTGAVIQRDVEHYIAGINKYIAEARLDPTKLPGEYLAIGRPQGPAPWKATDVLATASLVGGIFGKGGGAELQWSEIRQALRDRMGKRRGTRAFRDFRSANDPEAPVTVHRGRFPYQRPVRRPRKGSRAVPDPGSLRYHDVVAVKQGGGGPGSGGGGGLPLGGLMALPTSASNALLVSGRESASGRPLMVAGPQTGYFNPQILMEQEVHAPGGEGRPPIDAGGASFVGINLYVQLGRGRDYAWSATSAGQDNIDTFALRLCDETHYRYRGRCEPIEVLQKTVSWTPSAGDQTPAGSQTLRAERTKLGLVAARGTIRGKPCIFTKLRSTYFHEVDSAAGFVDFNTPTAITGPESFAQAASKIGYTFNWFYADSERISYFNSGANPVRARRIDHDLPVRARFSWRGWDPERWSSRVTPFARHPQVIDQRYLVNWNNKQARGYASSDTNAYSSTYRSKLLSDRVRRALRGPRKLTLPGLIDVMEVAGTGDLRAHAVLPPALRIVGEPKDPRLRAAVATLRAWRRAGGLRRDHDRNGVYDHTDAVALMDAWWPLWIERQFEPVLGPNAMDKLEAVLEIDNAPNNHGDHLGSAYQGSWYGFARKDLRSVLGRKVRGRYAREYCGRGRLKACRRVLRRSLRAALAVPRSELYGGDEVCREAGRDGDQWCYDAVRQRPVGGATQPLIHWINRPTYQQAVEVVRPVGSG